MVNPRKSTFFYGESQEISHFPMKSPCAEPPPHHASVGGIVRGLLGIRILFGRGDLHSAHLGDRRRDFGERRNGENTIDIYIYTYIYNSKNRYVLKKLSWYIIFLQWYITINGIPLKKMGVDKSLKACGDSKCDTCQMPMGFTIWLYECEKDVHGRSDVSNFTIYIYVYVCNVSVEMSIPISSV